MRDQWSMSNSLKVSLQTTIYSLEDRGWSRRRIARELGIDRETVGRYLRLAKPAISTTGLEEAGQAKSAISIAGLEEASEVKPAISTVGNGVGRKSQCEPLAAVIMAKVELGPNRGSTGIRSNGAGRCQLRASNYVPARNAATRQFDGEAAWQTAVLRMPGMSLNGLL